MKHLPYHSLGSLYTHSQTHRIWAWVAVKSYAHSTSLHLNLAFALKGTFMNIGNYCKLKIFRPEMFRVINIQVEIFWDAPYLLYCIIY